MLSSLAVKTVEGIYKTMKKVNFLMLFLLIFALSCSKEDIVNNSIDKKSLELTEDEIEQNNFDFTNDMYNFFGDSDYYDIYGSKMNQTNCLLDVSKYSNLKATQTVHGPFYFNSGRSKVSSNKKLVLNNVSGFATGVYFCDVHRYGQLNIPLPSNAVMGWIDSINQVGYSNYTNQTIGFTQGFLISGISGTIRSIHFNTYILNVRYNILGQNLGNNYKPFNSTSISVKYYYVTND